MAHILVVEDDADSCEALRQLLVREQHEADCVPNGRAALAAVLGSMPDLVVLDLALPEMDGVKFLEVVRSYLRLQALPVLVWTGHTGSPIVEKAKAFQISGVIAKGQGDFAQLLAAIENVLMKP